MNKIELDFLIEDTLDLGERILGMDALVQSITEEALRTSYEADIADLIMIYKDMEFHLELELVKFIQKQKEEGIVDFTLRRILKDFQNKLN